MGPQRSHAASLPFQDPGLPVDERVRDLVPRTTVEGKISRLVYEAPAIPRLGVPENNRWNGCLRGEWGFDGYVVSDRGAIEDFHARSKYTADRWSLLNRRPGV